MAGTKETKYVETGPHAIPGIDHKATPFVPRVDLECDPKRAFCTNESAGGFQIVSYEEYLLKPCPDCRSRELERERAAEREAKGGTP